MKLSFKRIASGAAALLGLLASASCGSPDPSTTVLPKTYDTVLIGGRVMDPETGLDGIRNIGLLDGEISAISEAPLTGKTTINADGLVVAPGFIDLHAHGQHLTGQQLQAQDGVTTALEMEIGFFPIRDFYAMREGKGLINYGATVGHICIRIKLKYDLPCYNAMDPTGSARRTALSRVPPIAYYGAASPDDMKQMLKMIEEGLQEGGLGIGLGIEYTPGAGRKEIYEIFKEAGKHQAPVVVHARRRTNDIAPGMPIAVLQELIANSALTNAPLQFAHIASTGITDTPVMAEMIANAQAQGLDITAEVYPYTAGSTSIGSALFDGPWQEVFGISYDGLAWSATGERLTAETYEKYRADEPQGTVIIHKIPEDIVRYAIAHPAIAIASDGMPWRTGKEHPRGAGSFARVLGKYVREEQALDLMQALKKMTIMPAQRMESFAPMMARKGRVQVGADADLVLFNPDTVIDRATFDDPMQSSEGIIHVLVGGVFVVKDAQLQEGVSPGRPILNKYVQN